MGAFKPYVGARQNYTLISSVKFEPAVQTALQPSLEKNSFGFAVQAGFGYGIAKNTDLNVDIKKVQIRTDVKSAGVKVGEFKIDPFCLAWVWAGAFERNG